MPPHCRRRTLLAPVTLALILFALVVYKLPPYGENRDPASQSTILDRFHFHVSRIMNDNENLKLQTTMQEQMIQDRGSTGKRQVPVEIHIMSKCPDARDCMARLVAPALKQVAEFVDFKISFIGRVNRENGGVTCKHGPSECLGDMVHLCAQRLYPLLPPDATETNSTTFLPFSKCLLHDYSLLPNEAFIQRCAGENGVNFEKLNKCISDMGDRGGMEMLRKSCDRSEKAGVRLSCTVRLEEEVWCVRDGGEWKDCKGGHTVRDLVKEIKRRYGVSGEGDGEEL